MIWPAGRVPEPKAADCPAGYALREATQDDIPAFRALMNIVALGTWDDEKLTKTLTDLLPGGWQLIIHDATGAVVATGMATRRPVADLYPNGDEVGWFAAHPEHAGQGLGRAIVAATLSRTLELRAECIYLQTDDFRLPAVKTYLGLGLLPHLWAADMPERWRVLCEQLNWPYTPDAWPRTGDWLCDA
jgi:mycothiol synthase